MKNFFVQYNLWYRFQQVIILILHLILLKWMYYALSNAGSFSILAVFYHFLGMSFMGAILIRSCAYWANYHYRQELKLKAQEHEQLLEANENSEAL